MRRKVRKLRRWWHHDFPRTHGAHEDLSPGMESLYLFQDTTHVIMICDCTFSREPYRTVYSFATVNQLIFQVVVIISDTSQRKYQEVFRK